MLELIYFKDDEFYYVKDLISKLIGYGETLEEAKESFFRVFNTHKR
jgi:hypothetical protein